MSDSPRGFCEEPWPYHTVLELEIESLSNGGVGVGRVDGWVVMVPFALPEEKVRARIYRNHGRYSEADLMEVLEPSPHRVEPRCALFGVCGGCQYQNLQYAKQLAWKRKQLEELLAHLLQCSFPVAEVMASPRDYAYRSKITPHFAKPRRGELGAIGFLRVGRRSELVDVTACPIASEAINARLPEVRELAQARAGQYRRGATLLLRESAEGVVVTDPQVVCRERVGELTFSFLAGDFFQNNPSILPQFTEYVTAQAVAGDAHYLLDAYCGAGLFALCAAKSFREVVGVEINESSLEWARRNARENGIENARFVVGSAEAVFADLPHPPERCAVVIDPPRKGCSPSFISQLIAFKPSRVVYVSCHPATQMRDLKVLLGEGFRLEAIQPFDLFPQTKHLECVVTLSLER